MQFQVTIMQLFVLKLLIQGSPGKFCPLMHPYANSFALKSQSDFFFFFFWKEAFPCYLPHKFPAKLKKGSPLEASIYLQRAISTVGADSLCASREQRWRAKQPERW